MSTYHQTSKQLTSLKKSLIPTVFGSRKRLKTVIFMGLVGFLIYRITKLRPMLRSAQVSFYLPYSPIDPANTAGENAVFAGDRCGNGYIGDSDNALVKILGLAENIPNGSWPLVLSGISGTGKTALGVSVVSQIANSLNKKSIVFTADGYRRKLSNAFETNSIAEFRRAFSDAAAVFIDDIQRLSGYDAAQTELITLLDLLQERETPIVFTFSGTEIDSSKVDPRLISRLSSGLCINLNRPGLAARISLFHRAAEVSGFDFDDDAIQYLANIFVVTFPKIQAFFHVFEHYHRVQKLDLPKKITLPLVLSFLTSLTESDSAKIGKVLQIVASSQQLKVNELKSKSRQQSIVLARGIAVYLLRSVFHLSFSKIGAVLGGRDHSTIMHSFERIGELLETDRSFEKLLEGIKLNVLENCFLENQT